MLWWLAHVKQIAKDGHFVLENLARKNYSLHILKLGWRSLVNWSNSHRRLIKAQTLSDVLLVSWEKYKDNLPNNKRVRKSEELKEVKLNFAQKVKKWKLCTWKEWGVIQVYFQVLDFNTAFLILGNIYVQWEVKQKSKEKLVSFHSKNVTVNFER